MMVGCLKKGATSLQGYKFSQQSLIAYRNLFCHTSLVSPHSDKIQTRDQIRNIIFSRIGSDPRFYHISTAIIQFQRLFPDKSISNKNKESTNGVGHNAKAQNIIGHFHYTSGFRRMLLCIDNTNNAPQHLDPTPPVSHWYPCLHLASGSDLPQSSSSER
mgnify:CR=1 FL=1